MYRAAEMAVFDRNGTDVLLFALDTKGTEDGARSATKAAIKAGADVILGPILANNVKASAREAGRTNTPVIAFSTDQTVAGNGTYLLSFPPEAEVARVVDYVASTGATRFAYLGPDSAYGRRVKSAYEARVKANYGEITAAESYQGNDITVMQTPAQRLATFHAAGEKAAKENGGLTPMSFEAILLPEGGPDKDTQQPFLDAYDRTYGETATTLASLAYDAVMMGAYVADGDPVYQIQNGRFIVVDPAPRSVLGGT